MKFDLCRFDLNGSVLGRGAGVRGVSWEGEGEDVEGRAGEVKGGEGLGVVI